jgi:hypothetical protein
VLLPLRDVDEELARVVRVLQLLVHVDIDAPDQVYDPGEALVVDHHEIVDRHPGQVHHGLLQKVDAPVDIGVVDLVPAAPGDLHTGVPGDGGHAHRLVFRVEDRQGDRVGARAAVHVVQPHDEDVHRAQNGIDIGSLIPLRLCVVAPDGQGLPQVERIFWKQDLLQTKSGPSRNCQKEQEGDPENLEKSHCRDTSILDASTFP